MPHSDIIGNKNTFMDVNDLPLGSVIVRTEAGFDPLVTLAPPIKSCGTEFEEKYVVEERDVQFRRILNKNHSKLLAFRLNEVKVLDLHGMGLPEIFGCSIYE